MCGSDVMAKKQRQLQELKTANLMLWIGFIGVLIVACLLAIGCKP